MNANRIRVWAARLAAPVAFFLAAIVLVLIVQSAIGSDDGDTETTQATAPATPSPSAQPAGTTTAQQGSQRRRFYRVRRGDTLESIAAQFDTDVERLLVLNPGIDPLELTVGQRLRVR